MNKIIWLLVGEKETIVGMFLTRREARETKRMYIEDNDWFNLPQQKYRVVKCKLEEVKV